jgi:prepilin-type N-terminal cleavage/methylation domain-containing protein
MRHLYFSSHALTVRQRAFSLVELLVVLGISLILVLPFLAVALSMQQNYRANHAKMEALANARGAMETLCADLKNISSTSCNMQGSAPSSFENGDRIDNNGNGSIDEQVSTSTYTMPPVVDRHAEIGSGSTKYYERWKGHGKADMGDLYYADDITFTSCSLSFDVGGKTVTYRMGQGLADSTQVVSGQTALSAVGWKGDASTRCLVRQLDYTVSATPVTEIQPLAFDVLSFRCLYWDPNASPADQDWLTSWDSAALSWPSLETPSTVYIELTVYADPLPISSYIPGKEGRKIQTVTLRTAVNIDPVLTSVWFPRATPTLVP